MERYYITLEQELLTRELEERAHLFRDEPRRKRPGLLARLVKWLKTPVTAPREPVMDPWHATYIRPA